MHFVAVRCVKKLFPVCSFLVRSSKNGFHLSNQLASFFVNISLDVLASVKANERNSCAAFDLGRRVVAAAVMQDISPRETIKAIKAGGETDFGKVFIEFKKRAGVYGYGDLQIQRLLDRI